MAKWILKDTSGISIGGEFYQADEKGVVDVPDNVGGLFDYGFVRSAQTPEEIKAEKLAAEAAELAASEAAEAEEVAAKKKKGDK